MLNIGKMEEVAIIPRKRHIDIFTLQETRWCGIKSSKIQCERDENGCKCFYFGTSPSKYSVGITISDGFRCAIEKSIR